MSSRTAATTTTPCAACKLQRRKCTQECVFAPYFPPDQPQKFETVRNVFGASNVAKLLSELAPSQREDAVNSLAYEAEARLRDPVYGCVGLISLLQHRLKQIQINLHYAKKELATYVGPQAMLPIHLQPQNYSVYPQQQQQQQQMVESQQVEAAWAARDQQQELLRHQELMGFSNNNGFEQMSTAVDSGLWLASSSGPYSFQLEQQLQLQLQSQPLIQQQQQPLQAVIPKEHKRSRGQEEEEGAQSIGPSSF